jgi:hypothetical protein
MPGRRRRGEHREGKGFGGTVAVGRPSWVRSGLRSYGVMTIWRVEIPPVGAIGLP